MDEIIKSKLALEIAQLSLDKATLQAQVEQLQQQNAARDAYNELRGVVDDDSYGEVLNMGDPRYQQALDEEVVNLNLYNKDDNFDINDWI